MMTRFDGTGGALPENSKTAALCLHSHGRMKHDDRENPNYRLRT